MLALKDEGMDMVTNKNNLFHCYIQIPISNYYEREKVLKK